MTPNPNEPLWLPRGSVRALIALAIAIAFVVVVLRSSLVLEPKDFLNVVLLIVGFYFISQVAKGPTPPSAP